MAVSVYKISLRLALATLAAGPELGTNEDGDDDAPAAEIVLATKSLAAPPDTTRLQSYIDSYKSTSSTFNFVDQPLNGKTVIDSNPLQIDYQVCDKNNLISYLLGAIKLFVRDAAGNTVFQDTDLDRTAVSNVRPGGGVYNNTQVGNLRTRSWLLMMNNGVDDTVLYKESNANAAMPYLRGGTKVCLKQTSLDCKSCASCLCSKKCSDSCFTKIHYPLRKGCC